MQGDGDDQVAGHAEDEQRDAAAECPPGQATGDLRAANRAEYAGGGHGRGDARPSSRPASRWAPSPSSDVTVMSASEVPTAVRTVNASATARVGR